MVTRFAVLMMLAAVLCGPALAQDAIKAEKLAPLNVAPQDEDNAVASTPVPAADEEGELTPEDQALLLCQTKTIMGSTNDAAVGPDYVPGVDAYGNDVVPADVNGGVAYTVPERIDIPLNIDILDTVGVINAPTPALSTNVGTVSILKGGQVLFNGQDVSTNVQDYCNTHMNQKANQP